MDNKDKSVNPSADMEKLRHRMIYDITRLESFSLNTVVSGFMEYNNKMIDLAKKAEELIKKPRDSSDFISSLPLMCLRNYGLTGSRNFCLFQYMAKI